MTEEEEKPRDVDVLDDDDEEDDDDYPTWIQSIRSKTGLETAIEIDWPTNTSSSSDGTTTTTTTKLNLSTCLQPADIAPMFDGTQWAGTRVWRASIVATQYLLQQKQQQLILERQQGKDDENKTKTISFLELGCGLGVPGMVLHSQKK